MRTTLPVHGLATMRDEIDRLFNRRWDRDELSMDGLDSSFPPAEIIETHETLSVKLEVPGMDVKDLHVTVHENALTVRGEKQLEARKTEERIYWTERVSGSFIRTIPLPVAVDATKVNAKVRNGVLTVTLPKVAQAKDHEIPVLTG